MYIHLKIVGGLLIGLSLFHIIFPKYFKWKNELSGLSLINRQMMQSHTFFIALTLLLMGMLCISSTASLLETELGTTIITGLAFFWITRLFFQFFVYSSKLWKGKKI